MSDILRQLTANLIPTVSGGAYQDAREVSIVWNTRRKHRFLPEFRCRMHQTRPSTLFSPIFSLAREKIGPPAARQKRPRRNEPPQATSLILCARFFLSKPQTEFAVWVLSQICDNLSVSLRLTAPLKGEPGVRAHSQCLPLIGGAFVRCGGESIPQSPSAPAPFTQGSLGLRAKKAFPSGEGAEKASTECSSVGACYRKF